MTEETQVSPELIAEAKEMGWVDKPDFRGNPDHWVPADQYVEKGRSVLPIVNAHNKTLREQLTRVTGQMSTFQSALQAANATIEALSEANAEDVREQVEAARKNLRTELEAASRDGDHAAVAEITDKMTQLNAAEEKPPAKTDTTVQQRPQLAPEIVAWYDENSDFTKNRRAVALANGIAAELRENGETVTGRAFMDMVKAEAFKALGLNDEGRPGRTEAGTGGGGRQQNTTVGKSYADLPTDAKAACDKAEKRLVGENRLHKTQASWRASYVKQYFKE